MSKFNILNRNMSFGIESAWIICQRSWEHHYGHKEIMWSEQYGHKNMLRVRKNRIESGQITKKWTPEINHKSVKNRTIFWAIWDSWHRVALVGGFY